MYLLQCIATYIHLYAAPLRSMAYLWESGTCSGDCSEMDSYRSLLFCRNTCHASVSKV